MTLSRNFTAVLLGGLLLLAGALLAPAHARGVANDQNVIYHDEVGGNAGTTALARPLPDRWLK